MTPEGLLRIFAAAAADDGKKFKDSMETYLINIIQTSNAKVYKVFFGTYKDPKYGFSPESISAFSELAGKYICYLMQFVPDTFSKTVKQTFYKSLLGSWFAGHDSLGLDILDCYLMQTVQDFAAVVRDKNFWEEYCKMISDSSFLTGEITMVNAGSCLHGALALAVVKQYSKDNYETIIKTWARVFPPNTLEQIQSYQWFLHYQETDHFKDYLMPDSFLGGLP